MSSSEISEIMASKDYDSFKKGLLKLINKRQYYTILNTMKNSQIKHLTTILKLETPERISLANDVNQKFKKMEDDMTEQLNKNVCDEKDRMSGFLIILIDYENTLEDILDKLTSKS
jgi:hypothetical protein